MKRLTLLILIVSGITAISVAQTNGGDLFRQEGIASWYGIEFDGKPTSSGEIFNSGFFTAAHPSLPFGTILVVTNKQNNRKVTVRVNDRGPFVAARIIDLSKAAAEVLDMLATGTAPVIVERAANTALGPGGEAVQPPAPAVPAPVQVVQAPAAPVAVPQPAAPAAQAPQPAPATPAVPAPQPVPAAPQPVPAAPVAVPAAPVYPEPQVAIPAPQPVPAAPAAVPQPIPQPVAPQPVAPQPVPQPAPVVVPQPVPQYIPAPPADIRGPVPAPGNARIYRLQVGAYAVPRNAVEAFDKLKAAGLNPAYERVGNLYRVVLPGLRAAEIQTIAQILGNTGFREALIREETGF